MIQAVSSISNTGLKGIDDGEKVLVDPMRGYIQLYFCIRERRIATGTRVTKCW